MSSSATLIRPRRRILSAAPPLTRERLVQRRVQLAWALMFLNALTWYQGYSFIHVPGIVGKGIAQGALPAALLVVLSLNRRLVVRPNVFLCLVTLIVLGAFLPVLQPQHFGTISGPSGWPVSWLASGC